MRSRGEAGDLEQGVAPLGVLVEAFLDDRAEILPDLGELLRLALGELAELLHDAVGHALSDRGEDVALLDQLARDVERQVGAVDHEADEAQPAGQEVGVLGDEHAADIELVAPLALRDRRDRTAASRDEGEDGIFVPSFGAPVERQRRLVELRRRGRDRIRYSPPASPRIWAWPRSPRRRRCGCCSAPGFSMRSIGTATAPEWSRTIRSRLRGSRNSSRLR